MIVPSERVLLTEPQVKVLRDALDSFIDWSDQLADPGPDLDTAQHLVERMGAILEGMRLEREAAEASPGAPAAAVQADPEPD